MLMQNKIFTSCLFLLGTLFLSGCGSSILNIGLAPVTQTIQENEIVEGLTYFKINIEAQSGFYILSSQPLSRSEADKLIVQLEAIKVGITNKLTSVQDNNILTRITVSETDPDGFSLGELVQFGQYDSVIHARNIQKQLAESGIKLAVLHTSLQANQGGVFEVSILKLESQEYQGKVISALGHNRIVNTEKTSKISENNNAVAAVNAGFFVFEQKSGVVGEPAGIAVIDGQLVSEAVNGRPALLIKNNPRLSIDVLENVRTTLTMELNQRHYLLNGINREAGKIFNCGQQDEQESVKAVHDYLCDNTNEIIVYNHLFGDLSVLPLMNGFSFFVNENNRVYGIGEPLNNKVPKGHCFIRAIGNKALLLKGLVKNNARLIINFKVQSSDGILDLEKGMYVVNGGPTLLIDGKENINVRSKEGWDIKEPLSGKSAVDDNDKIDNVYDHLKSRKQFYYNWMVRRHPRTAVGITKNGDAYIVVIYGRDPKRSVGASVTEMAKIMKSLNVDKAMNLDGGGSSIMIIDGIQTGVPSDVKGERAVGDAILFLPSK